ncbi:phosphate/phosphite/phosphonate ABC transporter substrate-binding protein [Pontiella sp.]|uniref:phosphate/phosphite/phosphonate ABC transporter substrate-binding protein n=1 Tax=Pontiella sp. TaxID=2837462 RepID=UPI00356A5192
MKKQQGMKIRIGIVAVYLLSGGICMAGLIGKADPDQELNIGYSDAMLAHVNEADAVAAIKTWVEMIKEAWNSSVPSTTSIYSGADKMQQALREGAVDLVAVPIDEFYRLKHEVALDHLMLGSYKGKTTVENLLLVHRDSGLDDLESLRGKNLLISAADRLGMCELWLDTVLLERDKGDLHTFFQSLKIRPKSSAAVHGVFFKTADACLVTRRNYDLITELNPQIGRKLKAIEISPPLVPAVICIRAEYDEESKQDICKALLALHETIRGQNMLSFFNSDQMVTASLNDLTSTLTMIELHTRLKERRTPQAKVVASMERTEGAAATP